MKFSKELNDIGFYTLSNQRAKTADISSPLQRCELILTDRCSFKCPYCRGLRDDLAGDLSALQSFKTVRFWIKEGLKNIRFSGGEPTLHSSLLDLVSFCAKSNVERIAVSTNGASSLEYYQRLISAGVNDFSISLDACCVSLGDTMCGVKGAWTKVISNIKELSKLTYVTVGMVFTEQNIDQCVESVMFANELGVSDIRVIPSAQYNAALTKLSSLSKTILDKYPILKYRIDNVNQGRHVRGIGEDDCNKCSIVLDDMAVASDKHFPCIIYMREYGKHIGVVNPRMRQERLEWFKNHNTHDDPICKKNCLDCLVQYNNIAVNKNDAVRKYLGLND